MSARVLVTGGAGFIGAHTVRRLTGTGHEVVVLDDLSTGRHANLEGADVELVEGSVLDAPLVDRLVEGCTAVVHLAAQPSVPVSVADPLGTHAINVTGTVHVLEAARRADAQVLFASSAAVYGPAPPVPAAESLPPEPVSPYAASKLAGEQWALSHGACYAMDVLALRFFNVYGPLQAPDHAYASVVPAFLEAARTGRPLTVHGDGLQTRDFVYVETVAEVLATAVERRVTASTPVNLAAGARHSLRELITEAEAVIGHSLAVEYGPPRAGDVRHSGANTSQLTSLFDDLVPVDLPTGLRRTWEWFSRPTGVPPPASAAGSPEPGGSRRRG